MRGLRAGCALAAAPSPHPPTSLLPRSALPADGSTRDLRLGLRAASADTWVGFGFPATPGQMLGSTAMILKTCATCGSGGWLGGWARRVEPSLPFLTCPACAGCAPVGVQGGIPCPANGRGAVPAPASQRVVKDYSFFRFFLGYTLNPEP